MVLEYLIASFCFRKKCPIVVDLEVVDLLMVD